MNTAYDTWAGQGPNPRWDEAATMHDPKNLAVLAQQHLPAMRADVTGFESAAGGDPSFAAGMRESYAPMYYDLHRMELATDPENAAHHIATRDLARKLAETHPIDLAAAENLCEGLGDRETIAREYMLYKHSLLAQHPMAWPDDSGTQVARLADLAPRKHDERDLAALDQTLNRTYGNHTRSDTLARVAFAHAKPNALIRGTTTYPKGDMILGTQPGSGELTYHNNSKTMVEEMAHSMLQRHYKAATSEYNDWTKNKTANSADKHLGLSTGAHEMLLPERGDYTEELAHAMAHGVFDKPSMHPESPEAPGDQSVAYAGNLFRKKPITHPVAFRSFHA